ncbi:MAG: zinc-dependent peptidase [Vicinamibacterales bacterium]
MTSLLSRLRRPRHRPRPRLSARWRRYLIRVSAYYRRLPPDVSLVFEEGLQRFLAERQITGIRMKLNAELRLLAAASAATLSAGWKGYRWSQVSEVLIYPDYFDRDFVIGPRELAGLADSWGTIVLSAPALRHSFEQADDGYHAGLHEFAHLLQEPASLHGVPRGLGTAEIREWDAIQSKEMEAVQLGRSVLDPYGGSTPREFFPVAVEAFFEQPVLMRERHGSLYSFLRGYFGQDPAVWAG